MFETIKELDEEIGMKQKNMQVTKDTNASLLSGNVDYTDEMNYSLMVKVSVTEND